MPVIAKFKVHSIELLVKAPRVADDRTNRHEKGVVLRRVKLMPIEGSVFGDESPSGCLDMLVVNPEFADQFELNGEYILTVEKAKVGLPLTLNYEAVGNEGSA